MTQPFYEAQTDVAVGSRGKASDINNLDSAVEQGFKNAHAYGIDSGTSAAYVVTMDTDATAYYDGMVVSFAPDNTNTVQSPTINVNGLGAKSTSSANQLSGVVEIGEIKTGYVYTFVYYNTGFVLQGSARLNTIPGPIGGTTPAAGTFTTLRATTHINCRGADNASATNAGFGEGVLAANSGGLANTAVGNDALASNTSGTGNTAVGASALDTNASGGSNTAVGYLAGNNYTGSFMTAVGASCMTSVSTGARNTGLGYAAGNAAGATSLENTFIGASTGLDLGAANIQSCVMLGYAAGSGLTGGNENTFVGTQAGVNPGGSYSNVTVVGKSAEATASNQVVLGNSSVTEATTFGKLQILSGTAVPAGGTAGAGLRFSTTANLGVFFGSGAPTLAAAKGSLYLRTDGSTTNDRMYANTDGGTTWTALITAA